MSDVFLFQSSTNIQEALELDERVVKALGGLGLKCVDKRNEMCVAAAVETLADAAMYHEIPLEKILQTLNALGIPPKPPVP
jgi:pyrrolidone-carboxylate peptidase